MPFEAPLSSRLPSPSPPRSARFSGLRGLTMPIHMPFYHVPIPLPRKASKPMRIPDLLQLRVHLLLPRLIVPVVRVQRRRDGDSQTCQVWAKVIKPCAELCEWVMGGRVAVIHGIGGGVRHGVEGVVKGMYDR